MKRILITIVPVLLLPLVGPAQTAPTGSLTIITTPPGAEAVLIGEASVSGITPVTFSYPLIGEYRLEITKHGYETYSTRLVLDPSKSQQLNINLSPRTGSKAALRSMVIPGWGQFYTSQKTKSFVLGLLFTGAAINWFDVDDEFKTKNNDFQRILGEYDNILATGGTTEELAARYRDLITAQQEAHDLESDRRVAAVAVAAIWGLNVIDALLFSPQERASFSVKGLTVTPSAGSDRVSLTLSKAF